MSLLDTFKELMNGKKEQQPTPQFNPEERRSRMRRAMIDRLIEEEALSMERRRFNQPRELKTKFQNFQEKVIKMQDKLRANTLVGKELQKRGN